MQRLLRLILLVTIALLSYSTSYSTNNLSTGEVVEDSVVLSIDDIRKINEKLIELKYEKQINGHLREVVETDSIIIQSLKKSIDVADKRYTEAIKKVKKERNILGGVSILNLVLLVIALL